MALVIEGPREKSMRVKVHGLEVEIENIDELRQIVRVFGDKSPGDRNQQRPPAKTVAQSPPGTAAVQTEENAASSATHALDEVSSSPARAIEALRAFVEAGTDGLPTAQVQKIVGREGKAIRRGISDLLVQLGFSEQQATEGFGKTHAGSSGRGWGLTSSGVRRAREILAMKR
jgi:hypothetical protein